MRKFKILFAALLCVAFASTSTFANDPVENSNEIRTEISKLVSQIDVSDIDATYDRTYVQFLVNSDNEIVVVNVSESQLDSRIKAKLNYKKLRTANVKQNELYTVPVVVKRG